MANPARPYPHRSRRRLRVRPPSSSKAANADLRLGPASGRTQALSGDAMAISEFKGRWVLVTGAASGIGFETALAFGRAGADIIALDLDETRLAATSRSIEALGRNCM